MSRQLFEDVFPVSRNKFNKASSSHQFYVCLMMMPHAAMLASSLEWRKRVVVPLFCIQMKKGRQPNTPTYGRPRRRSKAAPAARTAGIAGICNLYFARRPHTRARAHTIRASGFELCLCMVVYACNLTVIVEKLQKESERGGTILRP